MQNTIKQTVVMSRAEKTTVIALVTIAAAMIGFAVMKMTGDYSLLVSNLLFTPLVVFMLLDATTTPPLEDFTVKEQLKASNQAN